MNNTNKLKITYHNIAELIPDPDNARLHDRRNIDAIKQSIQRFGIRKPIVVHESSKICYAGNGVLTAALELGIETIPVAWIPADVPAEVAKAFAIFDNRTTDLSSFDPVKLDDLLASLPDVNLDNLLWTSDELDELLKSIETEDKEETFDVADAIEDEAEPITKTGDVWLCGEYHRVMCGDSTKAEDVEMLMKGEKADLIFTDPPFNIDYTYEDYNDNLTEKEYYNFLLNCFTNFLRDNQTISVYVMQRIDNLYVQWTILSKLNLNFKNIIIWKNKSQANFKDKYNYLYQPILFFSREGKFNKTAESRLVDWKGFEKLDSPEKLGLMCDIWDDIKPISGGCIKSAESLSNGSFKEHSAQMPIGLPQRAIIFSSDEKGLILDPFLGSGTTLIACQKTGRRCFGMEISPHYTDVVCRRFHDFTGSIPILEATGEPFPI